jgi:hypothetical protein
MAQIHIQVVNESTVLTALQVSQCVAALQMQLDEDYTPNYGIKVTLAIVPAGTVPNPRVWELVFLDDSDQAGALGYHETTVNDDPIGFVFARTAINDGESWTVTASHELLEMLGNPGISAVKELDNPDGSMTFHFKEICDPCEDDSYGYTKTLSCGAAILVSDFVLPRYWDSNAPKDVKFDIQGHITKPFEILPGGYISVLQVPANIQWEQINGATASARKVLRPFGRRSRHLIHPSTWRRSER